MSDLKKLAIIPARSGSKGLKDKNIKLLNGIPLLAYSIKAAKESGLFDVIYVSTDSARYADIAKEYGADVPFLRSEETSSDTASSWDVVKEALNRYALSGVNFEMVTLLQPTSPLRTAKDILNAFHIFGGKQANAVVSVCEMDHSPLWCNTLPEDHSLCGFIRPELSSRPRQKLDVYYRINGAVYMVNADYMMRCRNIYEEKCFAYIMDKEHSIDIDDEFDFKLAEAIIEL